jgi:large subunit ribosomal protein L13
MLNPKNVKRKWHVIDASGKSLGRIAVEAAKLIRGKHKPEFTPNVQCGDHVVVVNCDKIVLTGNKLVQKFYRRHTGYIGHLKSVRYADIIKTRSVLAVQLAVRGMLSHNSLSRRAMLKLHLYKGAEHNHEAQSPQIWKVR